MALFQTQALKDIIWSSSESTSPAPKFIRHNGWKRRIPWQTHTVPEQLCLNFKGFICSKPSSWDNVDKSIMTLLYYCLNNSKIGITNPQFRVALLFLLFLACLLSSSTSICALSSLVLQGTQQYKLQHFPPYIIYLVCFNQTASTISFPQNNCLCIPLGWHIEYPRILQKKLTQVNLNS